MDQDRGIMENPPHRTAWKAVPAITRHRPPLCPCGSPCSGALTLFGLFGSVPLFLLAAILYRLGEATPKQDLAIRSCVTGLIAGLAYGMPLGGLLSRMG